MATITLNCAVCGTEIQRTIDLPDDMEAVAIKMSRFSCDNCDAGPDKLEIKTIVP